MAGSERMLKAHHKNAVFNKALEDKKTAFDADCQKRTSKVQHEIYDIYFNEFVPLKEEVNKIQQRLPNIPDSMGMQRMEKLATIHAKATGTKTKLPAIFSRSIVSNEYGKSDQQRTESFLDLLRQQEMEHQQERRLRGADPRAKDNASPQWPDSDSDDFPQIDKKRLEILKTAIALTSQPAKSPEPKTSRRLRKSFLFNLRRMSKVVWEEELLKRVEIQPNSTAEIRATDKYDQKEGISVKNDSDTPLSLPLFAQNKIINENDDSEDDKTLLRLSFSQIRPQSQSTDSNLSDTRRESRYSDITTGDIDDMIFSDSSPDVFSAISERTGSYLSSSSYSSGSSDDLDDSGSFYSSSEYS
jgi:hypothetical protein